MNSITIKIIVFFLSLFILITVASQIYLYFSNDYTTETAVTYSVEDKTVFKGIFVRDEEVIPYSGAGVVCYPQADGSKIAKNSVVAYVYRSESDINAEKKINELEKKLASLEKVSNPGTFDVAQPELISDLISEEYRNSVYSCEMGNYSQLENDNDKLTEYLNIMSLVTGKEDNFDAEISRIKAEIDSLKANMSEPMGSIITENPGYFVSYADGYEDILTPESLETIGADEIKKITSNPETHSNAGIGKIINGYSWKLVGIVDNSQSRYTVGSSVELTFSLTPEAITATVDEIRPTDNPAESIIILSSDKLTFELVQHRVERVGMTVCEHNGIYVPRKAIRFNSKGEKGVYVLMGQGIIFKKLDVIYEGDDFVLTSNTGRTDYVLLYDDIIVDGISAQDEFNAGDIEDEDEQAEETTTAETLDLVIGESSVQTTIVDTTAGSETE